MKIVRSLAIAAGAMALAWSGAARAAVLDQVPDSAFLVMEIKNLDDFSSKIAKTADNIGLTISVPEMKDPLTGIEKAIGIDDKTVNRHGDLAVALFLPGTAGVDEADVPQTLVLVPVSDYQSFLGNFGKTKDDGHGITEPTTQPAGKFAGGVYIAHWGDYAAVAQSKALLAKPPTGIKLSASAAEQLNKDAIVYLNMDPVRASLLPRIAKDRTHLLKEMLEVEGAPPSPHAKNMLAAFNNLGLDEYQEVLQDTRSAVLSVSLTDDGVALDLSAEFLPDSKFGKLAAECKGTDKPLLGGLPDHKYFGLMGFANSPGLKKQFAVAVLDPIAKAFDAGGDDAKPIGALVKAGADQWNSMDAMALGMAVPDQLAKDGLIEAVQVMTGDSANLKKTFVAGTDSFNNTFKTAIPEEKGGASLEIKPDATTVEGVHFDQYTLKLDVGNGPMPIQAQTAMNVIFGSGGPGGWIGQVNDKTLLQVTGVDDQSQLLADAVDAARSGKDVLSDGKALQSVSALLPKQRAVEAYVYIDQVFGTSVALSQMFGAPFRIHVPADLPPVGVTLSSDSRNNAHVNVIVPTPLMQAMVGIVTDLRNTMFSGGRNGQGGL